MSSRAERGTCFCLFSTRNSRCFAQHDQLAQLPLVPRFLTTSRFRTAEMLATSRLLLPQRRRGTSKDGESPTASVWRESPTGTHCTASSPVSQTKLSVGAGVVL